MGSKALDRGITPLHIEIALRYSKSQNSEAVGYSGRESDVIAQICHEFADAGLLEMADDNTHWKATDQMRRYVESLCQVPLPVKQAGEQSDLIAHLEAVLKSRRNSDGDDTIKTRNAKIAAVLDEYVATTPQARL